MPFGSPKGLKETVHPPSGKPLYDGVIKIRKKSRSATNFFELKIMIDLASEEQNHLSCLYPCLLQNRSSRRIPLLPLQPEPLVHL